MDPRDPIAQAVDADFQTGLQDASRAQTILKMLPRLVLEKPQMRDVQATSGLPQTGQEAFADIGSLAGQAPSGIGQDVRMGTNLGDIYAKRADRRITADTAANQGELERARQANTMNVAQATQAGNTLEFVQRDRQIAHQIKTNERLLAQDGRMRLEFLMEQGKRVGPVDSDAFQAYSARVMQALRDPARRQALIDPQTGLQAMVGIIDEGMTAATGAPAQGTPTSPRAESALGVTSRMGGIPQSAPAGQPSWGVAPEEQAARDIRAKQIVQAEQTAPPGTDPAAAAAAAIVAPRPPQPFRAKDSREGNSAYEAKKQTFDQAEEARYRAEQQLAIAQRGEARDTAKGIRDEAKAQRVEEQAQEKMRKAADQMQTKSTVVTKAVDKAVVLLPSAGFGMATGRVLGAYVPGSAARDLDQQIDTIKANIGFQELADMRAASPTGGALGAVQVRELELLQAALGSLDTGQSYEQLKQNLESVKAHFNNWMKNASGGGGPSQEDLEFTARKHGIPVDEVKRRLGI